MSNPTKPGGGNKPQPYIAAGNGEESGQYTDKENGSKPASSKPNHITNCHIANRNGLYNPRKSKLVKKVRHFFVMEWGQKIPIISKPNSVLKKIINGEIVEERYYNERGEMYLEIHYTNHSNSKTHPNVPHIHRSKVINGVFYHAPQEKFQ